MKKILIVEDEVIIAIDLQKKLETLGYTVLDIVYNSDNLTDKINSLNPDLILLDINIEGSRNGIEMAHIINEKFKIPFLYVTSYTDQQTLSEVKETKPIGYVVKPFTIDDLKVELDLSIFRHSSKSGSGFPNFDTINKNMKVTEREYEIICDIKAGLKNDQIAKKHFISENTVKSHLKRIYTKFDVHSKIELVSRLMEYAN